jgi:catechol 2,3-dioxygenase-like lactoylglutathione lyase family enzyme
MKFGYVVLYVTSPDASLLFWKEKLGMVIKGSKQAGEYSIVRVGFADQDFSFELVPLDLMKNNPNNLDLATPSIAFYVADLGAMHKELTSRQVHVTEIMEHSGVTSFAFIDNESRGFAVLQG